MVLLVEDSDMDSELIQTALGETGVPVAVARVRDGVEMLEYLQNITKPRTPIALVLLDIKLPRMNGIELLRRLKSEDATKSLPVVMFTSSREKQDLLECYRAGANAYIVKPVEYDKLLAVLSYIVRFWCTVNELPVTE
jgi:CheY-like chemotaxis protein